MTRRILVLACTLLIAGLLPVGGRPVRAALPTARSAAPSALLDARGGGPALTRPFVIWRTWRLRFAYDCSAIGDRGAPFWLYLTRGPLSRGTQILRAQDIRGGGTLTERFLGEFYLRVHTPCQWRVVVRA